MSDNQRSNFNFETKLDLLTQFDINESSDPVYVLLTHDYFSTDSSYGKKVLKNYIHSLAITGEKDVTLLIGDKAVSLLEDEILLNDFLLLSESKPIYISDSACNEYNVEIPESVNCTRITDSEFISLVLDSKPILLS